MLFGFSIDIIHKMKTRNHPRHGPESVIEYSTNRNPAHSLKKMH